MLGVNPKPQKLQPDTNEDNMKDILSVILSIYLENTNQTISITSLESGLRQSINS